MSNFRDNGKNQHADDSSTSAPQRQRRNTGDYPQVSLELGVTLVGNHEEITHCQGQCGVILFKRNNDPNGRVAGNHVARFVAAWHCGPRRGGTGRRRPYGCGCRGCPAQGGDGWNACRLARVGCKRTSRRTACAVRQRPSSDPTAGTFSPRLRSSDRSTVKNWQPRASAARLCPLRYGAARQET